MIHFRDEPAGLAWSHVRSDILFQSVTIGCDGAVMLVTSEGVVTWRQGVSPSCPAGQAWVTLHNPGPGARVRSVEAGRAGLLALDTENKLWLRRGQSPQYPEVRHVVSRHIMTHHCQGTSWSVLSSGVRAVSAGDSGHIWGVVDSQGVGGVLARRGVGDWEPGVGGGWRHLCARAWTQ